MKELLDTDRVNFLVWRYLLESNYRETAAKLQKEWRVKAPHHSFDFSRHVNNYALTTLLNKGLLYEDYQRQFAESQQPATAEARGVFGPLKFEPPPRDGEDEEDEGEDSEPEPEVEDVDNNRKRRIDRQLHALPNGSPAKRQRLNNGYENGADSATTPMEIETQTDNNHAYPSPLEGEQVTSPLPRTEGPSRSTQIPKVFDLTQETIFLGLGADEAAEASEAAAHASDNPLVLLCKWNPRDPSILATAGTDALARVWTVSRGAAIDNSLPSHVNGITSVNLIDDDSSRHSTVTAMAWNPRGDAIAMAVESANKARIRILGPDGTHLQRFDGIEPPIVKLCWSPNDDLVLGVSPESSGTLATVFSSSAAESLSHFLEHDIVADPVDAAWISETEFILCGGDLLASFRCAGDEIVPVRAFPTSRDEHFTQVLYDWRTNLVATASDRGVIDLWDEGGQRRSISAHMGSILTLQWQPLQSEPSDDERLLASGGDDGIIFIWNVRSAENKYKYMITMPNSAPVVGLSITPDGAFIAAATSDQILIYKIGEHTFPRAVWDKMPHPGWESPKNTESDEENLPCLGWDAEGQRLAYAANSRLAVINFR